MVEKDNCLYFHFAGSDYYHEMLKVACQSLSPLQQNLLKFSLSLRSYSATVQAFQQVSTESKTICTTQTICRALPKAQEGVSCVRRHLRV